MIGYFILGLLAGWLLEWIVDWAWWRRGGPADDAADPSASVSGTGPLGLPAAPGRDDLTRIDGIGPQVALLLGDRGITSFAALATTPAARLAELGFTAEASDPPSDPGFWPAKALLAARGDWAALERLETQLRRGARAVD